MWDSEQFSQNFGSCSQGSQNSSTDLFSQSKMSQHKGFSSIDVWSQPTNSQKMPEVRLSGDRKTWIEKLIIKCTMSAIKMRLVSLTLASLDKRLNVHLFTISVFCLCFWFLFYRLSRFCQPGFSHHRISFLSIFFQSWFLQISHLTAPSKLSS